MKKILKIIIPIPILRFRLFTIFISLSPLFLNNTFLFKNNKINNKKNIYFKKIFNKYDGYDMRYIDKNNFNNSSMFFNYLEIFNKYKIYKLLKNENVSINTKLKLIKKENIFGDNIVPNITKGELYKDWNFFI